MISIFGTVQHDRFRPRRGISQQAMYSTAHQDAQHINPNICIFMLNYTLMIWLWAPNTGRMTQLSNKLAGLLCVLLLCSTCSMLVSTPAKAQTGKELEQVTKSLKQTERELAQSRKRREQTLSELQSFEKQIAERTLRFEHTREKVRILEKEKARLQKELGELDQEFQLAQEALTRLVQSAYMMGRQSALKVMLSQQGTQHIARLNHYTRNISNVRKDQLEALLGLQTQIQEKNRGLDQQQKQLAKLTAALEEDQRYLGQLRDNRRTTLQQLDATISSKTQEMDYLQSRKIRLEKLMADIAQRQKVRAERKRAQERRLQAIKNIPPKTRTAAVPAASKNGLPLPANARIVARFGDKRKKSGLPWSGILMEGPEGSDIRAINSGEVVYADWLPGYGQMIIVDHGQGLMSLYGHNKRIHRSVGDKVEQSDIIASMGDTAGLQRPALYFEIRQNGVARDPLIWCSG